ncbi:hypothetical protein DA2_1641 [Desulfovibrio sp. A2]|nr:hypothetical protein DA2_1641 [Desulfovibrio sp. A2]
MAHPCPPESDGKRALRRGATRASQARPEKSRRGAASGRRGVAGCVAPGWWGAPGRAWLAYAVADSAAEPLGGCAREACSPDCAKMHKSGRGCKGEGGGGYRGEGWGLSGGGVGEGCALTDAASTKAVLPC